METYTETYEFEGHTFDVELPLNEDFSLSFLGECGATILVVPYDAKLKEDDRLYAVWIDPVEDCMCDEIISPIGSFYSDEYLSSPEFLELDTA